MAAISGFSASIQKESLVGPARVERRVKLDFGDGTDTYPTGGIPVSKGALGCPNEIENVSFLDAGSGDGYVYKFDYANEKILLYINTETGTPDDYQLQEVDSSDTPQGSVILNVTGN